jgi:mono/diheme cytochrome c family protein
MEEEVMRGLVWLAFLLFLLGFTVAPMGVKAQTSPGKAGPGTESGLPGHDRPFKSLGEQIYSTGSGTKGRIPFTGGPRWLSIHGGGCVICHGIKGRGGVPVAMGTAIPADITYRKLTVEDHYTDVLIKRAITQGLDEEGKPLNWTMPRWHMSETDLNAVIDYLKTLK